MSVLRTPQTAGALALALLLLTPMLYAVWWPGSPAVDTQARFPGIASPFPALGSPGPVLHVVLVPPDANTSTRLTLASLEGLVNRRQVALYLDAENESGDPTSILTFVRRYYGVSTEAMTVDEAYAAYLPSVAGLVVFDPSRPESVNVVTTYAAIHEAAIVGPDTAASLSAAYRRPILFDYGASDWSTLDAISAQDRALREFYPAAYPALLAILPPEQIALRDYLVATRTFVFYDNQGALASPQETAQTIRILSAAPRNIPILGWFRSPTLTEENSFVQLASAQGKYVIDGEDVPNLSALTAYGRGATFAQPPATLPQGPVGTKVYVVVAVADGDSASFVARQMRKLWNDPARGTFPVAWSLNPLLADLAPPYVAYYYAQASAEDRFVAGPSGAGYLYPDYLGPGDLAPYLQSVRRHLMRLDMNVAWLLNGFTSSEIPYSAATLSAYVDALHPAGLALDYDDQPTTAGYWMQGDASAAAPVVRSTQLWTTEGNFLAKVDAALGAQKPGPYFLWTTVYPWRFNLTQARAALDALAAQTGRDVEVVSPDAFFSLMTEAFRGRGAADLASMRADPVAPYLLGGFLTAAQDHLAASTQAAQAGNTAGAAYESYQASAVLQQALVWEDAFFLVVPLVILAGVALLRARRRGSFPGQLGGRIPGPLALCGILALFMLDLQAVLRYNFWTYGYVIAGVIAAAFGGPLGTFLWRRSRRHGLAPTLLFIVASVLTLATSAAFPLAALTGAAAAQSVLRDGDPPPRALVPSVLVGTALGLYLPPSAAGLALLSLLSGAARAALPVRTPVPPTAAHPRGTWSAALCMVLALLPLAAFLSFSVGLRLEIQADALRGTGFVILLASTLYAAILAGFVGPKRAHTFAARALIVSALFSAGTLLADASVTTALMLAGASTAFALAAWALLDDLVRRGGETGPLAFPLMTLLPFAILFVRMPPVAYSLTVGLPLGGFPQIVEYALYAPPILWLAIALLLLLSLTARRRSTV